MASRILVVDDESDVEPLVLQAFRRRIRSGELSFSFARDGREALEILQNDSEFDVVLSDINMPRMDGLTLLGHLQSFPDLRAVVISAYGDMNNLRTAMNRGAFDFVVKPIDFADLEATLNKTLEDLARLREMRAQRDAASRARDNLSRYFSPNLVEFLARREGGIAPVRRQVSAMFVDLAGFTTFSESEEPEVVMEMLRSFHARMVAELFRFDGTLEKFIGDALLAVFGVLEPQLSDPARALRCAQAMLKACDSWNVERERAGLPMMTMGIGLHCGPAVLGDIGDERAMAFTAIGDTINSASRLQNLTRDLKCRLVVSRQMIEAVGLSGDAEAMTIAGTLVRHGEANLKGRSQSIEIFRDC
jgi:adenylate cyclase